MTNTHAYIRVSTARQEESPEVQRSRLVGYAQSQNLNINCIHVDKVSGTMPLEKRPSGSKLLAQLNPGDVVICTKLDRMFRSALDAISTLERLKENSISLHLLDMGGDVTGNGVSQLVFTILAAVAQLERERIAERIREVKQHQKAQGKYLGGKKPVSAEIKSRILASNKTYREIQKQIFRETGMSISTSTISKVKNENT